MPPTLAEIQKQLDEAALTLKDAATRAVESRLALDQANTEVRTVQSTSDAAQVSLASAKEAYAALLDQLDSVTN